jgi:hypothetical protein
MLYQIQEMRVLIVQYRKRQALINPFIMIHLRKVL